MNKLLCKKKRTRVHQRKFLVPLSYLFLSLYPISYGYGENLKIDHMEHGGELSLFVDNSIAANQVLQQRSVSGRVMDTQGNLLQGVSVTEKGTANSTTTDHRGAFTLNLTTSSPVVAFRFVGYEPSEVNITDQKVIEVSLTEDVASIDEVVVVGFGTQKKVSVTGAISDVPVANLQRIATPSFSNALAGSMPGIVTRQSSGEPGYDGAAVYIRGFGTWENRSPLILVDGVERDLN